MIHNYMNEEWQLKQWFISATNFRYIGSIYTNRQLIKHRIIHV